MNCLLQCTCGKVKGTVDTATSCNRCLCYCKTCQAFAHFLGRSDEILDDQGGTAVLQTVPGAIDVTEGKENIGCMRLSQNGLLRWYTTCCNTPIGNTPANYKMPFVGLIENCLTPQAKSTLDARFGPLQIRVNTQSAKGQPKPKANSVLGTMLKLTPALLRARLNGSFKRHLFFTPEGTPIAAPKVLDRAEYRALRQSL